MFTVVILLYFTAAVRALTDQVTVTTVAQASDYRVFIDEEANCKVDKRFLSFAIGSDMLNKTSQINFESDKLRVLLKALSPSFLRLGGAKSNFINFLPRASTNLPSIPVTMPPLTTTTASTTTTTVHTTTTTASSTTTNLSPTTTTTASSTTTNLSPTTTKQTSTNSLSKTPKIATLVISTPAPITLIPTTTLEQTEAELLQTSPLSSTTSSPMLEFTGLPLTSTQFQSSAEGHSSSSIDSENVKEAPEDSVTLKTTTSTTEKPAVNNMPVWLSAKAKKRRSKKEMVSQKSVKNRSKRSAKSEKMDKFHQQTSKNINYEPIYLNNFTSESKMFELKREEKMRKYSQYHEFNLTANTLDQIYDLVKSTGARLIFDANAFKRRNNGMTWDPNNTVAILDYVARKGYKIVWQLGNEPDRYDLFSRRLSAADVAMDYVMFKKILSDSKYRRPLLLGPDVSGPTGNHEVNKYLETFLRVAQGSVDVLSWHQFYEDGKNMTEADFTEPRMLDKFIEQNEMIREVTRKRNMTKPIWLTETGSSWSGAKNLSNRFADGFPFLDRLGVAANFCTQVVIRKSLLHGKNALLDLSNNLRPNPDYYLSVLYKRLVGRTVLKTSMDVADPKFRVYAHCAKKRATPGAVVAFTLNLHTSAKKFSFDGYELLDVEGYVFTAKSMSAETVKLNGNALHLGEGNTLPRMKSKKLTQPLTLPAKSLAFFVLDTANFNSCWSF